MSNRDIDKQPSNTILQFWFHEWIEAPVKSPQSMKKMNHSLFFLFKNRTSAVLSSIHQQQFPCHIECSI